MAVPPPWTEEVSRGACRKTNAQALIPIAEPEFTKVRINENPLLKVPPASMGNQDPSVPLAKQGELNPVSVPLAKRGEP